MLLFGEYTRSDYYGCYCAKAQNPRSQIMQSYDDLRESCDMLMMPTTAILPTPIPDNEAPLRKRIIRTTDMIHNACQFDATARPAISVPCGSPTTCPSAS